MIAEDIPYFKLPFQCGQVWSVSTYAGHWPNANSLDMFHAGGETQGQPLHAPATGVLEYTGWWSEKSGWTIILDHGGGWKTYYLHLMDASFLPVGSEVKQGQHMGYVGNSGIPDRQYVPHLHYTVMEQDVAVRAVFSGVPAAPHAGDIGATEQIVSRNCGSSWDGDAMAELVTVSPDGTVTVYLNKGDFKFAKSGEVIATGRDQVHFADLDGDGRTELVDRPHADLDGDRRDEPQDGTFADLDGDGRDEPVGEGIYADIDGNGRDELVKVNANGDVEAYWNSGNGEFAQKPDILMNVGTSRVMFA
ncbi:VCBS repeat domain-containing M23 family metallopeptidase [Allorhizocola rhizosphaerae]|uniref:VCBS repeat domain-containing M23 family metallopeptidase n=1 Tax=Allorhizocola rhizosphaerae TaxID=1872709 RepID=UPI000E3C140E|nr:VCBS repeat domain-containing M23 family metallopeptidase [Allorhizocola rhizosphaerae]